MQSSGSPLSTASVASTSYLKWHKQYAGAHGQKNEKILLGRECLHDASAPKAGKTHKYVKKIEMVQSFKKNHNNILDTMQPLTLSNFISCQEPS